MMNKIQPIVNSKWFPSTFFIFAIGISVFLHYRVFSLDIIGVHVWRQTLTQTVIENFATVDFNIFNPRLNDLEHPDGIFRMEFPLAQWLVAGLYKLFGNHLFISRLFFYFTTLISTFGMYKLIIVLTSNKLNGLLVAWFFLFSPILYYYSVNPLPDNLALCFGIWSIYFWIKYLRNNLSMYFILSCLLLSLSVAVKLPFLVFSGMYLSKLFNENEDGKSRFKFMLIPILFLIPPFIWYKIAIPTWSSGGGVLNGIIDNNNSLLKLLDIFQFNLISTLPELLVNFATFPLFLIGLYFTLKDFDLKKNTHQSFFFVGVLCTLYFLFEINVIDKIHDYYLFPFLPLLFIIVAKALNKISILNLNSLKYLVMISFVICPITAYLRSNSRWNQQEPGFSKEYLMGKKQLKQIIPTNSKIIVYEDISCCIVLYHLNRKGWNSGRYDTNQVEIKNYILKGAKFLVTDCEIKENPLFTKHLDTLLYSNNSIKLYKIK